MLGSHLLEITASNHERLEFGCLQLSLGVVAETSSRLVTSGSPKRVGLRTCRVQNLINTVTQHGIVIHGLMKGFYSVIHFRSKNLETY